MNRNALLLITAASVTACAAPNDDRPVARAPEGSAPAEQTVSVDAVAARAVSVIVMRDMPSLAAMAHPEKGVRFSPYPHVDTIADVRLPAADLTGRSLRSDSLLWGSFDGSGEPIRRTLRQYFDRFVADFDLMNAPRIVRDSAPVGTGNVINNIREVYRGATIIEYHQPGRDPRYGGMDWRSLWLVFEQSGGKWYVVGIVHGEWTS